MQLKSSEFLMSVKEPLKKLLDALLKEYEYASILAADSKAKSYNVSRSGIGVAENSLLSTRGFVAKVYDGKGYCEYSFNEFSEADINKIMSTIAERLIPIELPEGVTLAEYAALSDEPCVLKKSSEYQIHPEEMGDAAIIEKLTAVRSATLAQDERLLDVGVSCAWQQFSKLFLSKNRDLEQNVLWTTGSLVALAARGEEIKDYYKGFSNLGGAEILSEMESGAAEVAKVAIELLDSEPMIPGEYECICTPETTGMIVHEAFGHGVEMDMFVKKRALAEQYIDKYVASELVTMHDGAAVTQETGTYFFDDEGVLACDTVVIEKGILKRGISDIHSAQHLGTTPTGNGRRESYERKAYTRMTNTYFEGGNDKLEDMIASIEYGFLLENPSSGMEDPKNWGIQCMVNIAREIKDGKLTGKIFSPIVLTGYVPDLLKSISMMSENVVLGGGGFCGKGYKEWVKVSDGGPYIKAKIRLG